MNRSALSEANQVPPPFSGFEGLKRLPCSKPFLWHSPLWGSLSQSSRGNSPNSRTVSVEKSAVSAVVFSLTSGQVCGAIGHRSGRWEHSFSSTVSKSWTFEKNHHGSQRSFEASGKTSSVSLQENEKHQRLTLTGLPWSSDPLSGPVSADRPPTPSTPSTPVAREVLERSRPKRTGLFVSPRSPVMGSSEFDRGLPARHRTAATLEVLQSQTSQTGLQKDNQPGVSGGISEFFCVAMHKGHFNKLQHLP